MKLFFASICTFVLEENACSVLYPLPLFYKNLDKSPFSQLLSGVGKPLRAFIHLPVGTGTVSKVRIDNVFAHLLSFVNMTAQLCGNSLKLYLNDHLHRNQLLSLFPWVRRFKHQYNSYLTIFFVYLIFYFHFQGAYCI